MNTTEQTEELVIDSSNFDQYFFDARKHKGKKGQVLARFSAVAEFIDGQGKTDIVGLIKKGKGRQAAEVMKKIHGAKEPDCYRVCRQIAEDLLIMEEEKVVAKPYEYAVEYLFYTQRDYVPNNHHWEMISLMEYDEETKTYKSRIDL